MNHHIYQWHAKVLGKTHSGGPEFLVLVANNVMSHNDIIDQQSENTTPQKPFDHDAEYV